MELHFIAVEVAVFRESGIGRAHALEHLLDKNRFELLGHFLERARIVVTPKGFHLFKPLIVEQAVLDLCASRQMIQGKHQITTNSALSAPDCLSASSMAIRSPGEAPTLFTDLTISSSVAPGPNLNMGFFSSSISIWLAGTTTV